MTTYDALLQEAIQLAQKNHEGKPASYIPQLAQVDRDLLGVAVHDIQGNYQEVSNLNDTLFTLQSVAKVALLIGMLEEFGPQCVFSWVMMEPTHDGFASVAGLEQYDPHPSNPMINAGAITLCSHIPGDAASQQQWLETWMQRLFNQPLKLNTGVFLSEKESGDRNRSIAYLLKTNKMIQGDVDRILDTYFRLCSFETSLRQASYLPMLLANRGLSPQGDRVISKLTVEYVLSIMATCGLYNESGSHLVHTGLPAKSGVSGLIIAVALGKAGIATFAPCVGPKGTSIRGKLMLQYISQARDWHFAS